MISVLIPTYNYTCYQLVADLQQQLEASGELYEVIVAEDGSKDQVSLIANWKINDLPNCRVIRRKENSGRAIIRNFLANEARGEWLLYMDSDARIISKDFIGNYIRAIKEHEDYDIIIGGLLHTELEPSPKFSLRYRYEKEADKHRNAMERQQNPYQHLTTFNLMARKKTIMAIPFDEECKEYGYEDTLLGVEFKKNDIKIAHIDNPLEHVGLETNDVYLRKVETAICTLKHLGDKMVPYSHLGIAAKKIQKWHATLPIILVYHITRPLLRRNLLGPKPDLRLLAFYKLGYFLSL